MTKKTNEISLAFQLFVAACLVLAVVFQPVLAREAESDSVAYQRYVVELLDPPLALYDGGELSVDGDRGPKRMAATAPQSTGEKRLDVRSPESLAYLGFLGERQAEFAREMEVLLGRMPAVSYRYRTASNGLAIRLTADEAALLAESPLVRSVSPDIIYKPQTYAGPEWLGAGYIWNGDAGFPAARGEGIVVGNIDTGVNWDHPSFDDSDFNYVNPYGVGLGLCSEADVLCNNKLVGVYDFVEDDPDTEDWVEENTKGKDNNGHGSHTAGTAAGSPVNVNINGAANETISGVAPRAHIVSYRVCYMGEPQSEEAEGCSGSAIMAAIDQAVTDGVDVINYSIGGDARDPWNGGADRAFLAARSAGIFVASSAGNTGPNERTVTSPALAPWIVAVGNATHNNILGSTVTNFSGGSLPAPDDMIGATQTDGTGKLVIVHARDFGNAFCGAGEAELQSSCATNTGASNPWAGSKPFNGEIVVCDRGTYGRIEKGKNVMLAGAGGYILANTAEHGESIVADDHCLPATHIGRENGDILRTWLGSGSGHGAQLSGLTLVELDSVADQLSFSSSRGPAVEPVQDTLKPNVIAPGTAILAAGFSSSNSFLTLSGTSMASPHIAGAAALLKSVHPDWTANQLASAIEMTATQELAKDENGAPATTQQVGAGRPVLDQAANAGLFLNVTPNQFLSANPASGGNPHNLNLPGVVNARCKGYCTFFRSVTDMMGGGSWTATPVGFPAGTVVTVTPSSFDLSDGGSRNLTITVNVDDSDIVGDWVSGKIRLSASGSSDQYLTVSVYSYGGDLPDEWAISTDNDGDWTEFGLTGLVSLPNATFSSGGPVKPQERTETHVEDPSDDDPYDGGEGVFTQWYNLPNGALWLYAETLASTAPDIDLFVGRDEGDGFADEWEELCSSTTPQDLERCDLYNLPPGNYWILVQNWTGSGGDGGGDAMTLRHAVVEPSAGSGLSASGPGITGVNESFPVRVSWDNFEAAPGETWLGAVGVGSSKSSPSNVGVIPVRLTRSGVAAAESLALMDGRTHGLALAASGKHDRMFIDIPPGAQSLTVSATGADDTQSSMLKLELVRLDFEDGLSDPPFASPAGNAPVVASAEGSIASGPTVTVSGGVDAGRWYAVLSNGSSSPVSVEVQANVEFQGAAIDVQPGLWFPPARSGQGYDYNWGGADRALIWYTYDEVGLPTWYIASAPANDGNIWVA
ncbi:MAG: S8 family serine peptidase, partial [Xanthomonadales bacterium]|nr:S8 family serine peptidase [Xanthomonadales bacterium]